MFNGCVIFAIDNGEFKYTKLADIAAGLVKKYLNIPTTIITNKPPILKYAENYVLIDDNIFSERLMFNGSEYIKIKWFNNSRSHAYDLSPYDNTLLIDADFLIFEDSLKSVFESSEDFLCYTDVYDITGRNKFKPSELVSDYSIHNAWATVCYFTKSEKAFNVFEMMKIVRDNYDYYHQLFRIVISFRNDYALAIALHTLSGYGIDVKSLLGKMFMMDLDLIIEDFTDDRGLIYTYDNNRSFIKDTNIHILSKWALQNNDILLKIENSIC